MFGFLKKKNQKFVVTAPVTGVLTDLCEVNDPVFSQKIMGDGFAIALAKEADIVYSPVSAKVISLPDTKHAVGLVTAKGDEILVHIGIDTVNLKGQGFTALISQDDEVKQGQELIKLDRKVLAMKKVDLTTMVIFTKLIPEHQNLTFDKQYGDRVNVQEVIVKE